MNNDNNRHVVVIPLGSPSTDKTVPGLYCTEKMVIKSVALINGAGIAASNTDFVQLQLMNGSTEVAELDTRAAHEGAVTANVAKALNIVSGQEEQAAGSTLKVVYNETDSGTAVALTDAVLVVEYYPL